MEPTSSDRRRFLAQLGWGIGALAGARSILAESRYAQASDPPTGAVFDPDVEVALRAAPAQASMLPGELTDVWSLQGRVVRGDKGVLEDSGTPALGPTFRVRAGQRLRITLDNCISQETILHWHGLRVPAAADGHPRSAIPPGHQYTYEFEVRGRPGTYWYHAHPHQRTAEQVYRGLAGLFLIEDGREASSLALPAGAFDVTLAIQDRTFDARNQLAYLASPMARMRGFLGDRILVNGKIDASMRVAARAYRLRILNASNSRIYRLAWGDGAPLVVIGTDGGLLESPTQTSYLMLAPGERVEVWVDFGAYPLGTERSLVSLPFDGMTPVGMGPMGAAGMPQGGSLTILKVKVDRASSERGGLPKRLSTIERYRIAEARNAEAPRRIQATMQHMGFGINGRTFEMTAVAPDEHVKFGSVEAWEFDNTAAAGGMGMMGMMGHLPHPFHVHGVQFQVLRREGVTHSGYLDAGWKDTVLVMPGEKATVLMRFLDYPGIYLYHCHNLEHEDSGMMRNFSVDT
jgi:FtsP/CotA-like multicopper oxidase with cupredoxin domain